MSPYPAIRRNGTCTGSLWKSHARAKRGTIDSPSSTAPSGSPGSNADPSAAAAAFYFDEFLAEANERQRTHEFCVLVGNTLWSYSDVWAYSKGDPPTSEIRIVGASAWNPPSATRKQPLRQKPPSLPSSPQSSSHVSNSSLASETMSSPNTASSKCVDFIIVTYTGTHVRCSAPTPTDKDEWLAALNSGLEGSFVENRVETLMVLSKRMNESITESKRLSKNSDISNSSSAGIDDKIVQSSVDNARAAYEAEDSFRLLIPPPPQIEAKNARLSRRSTKNGSGQSDLDVSTSSYLYGNNSETACPPKTGYHSPCDDWSAPPSEHHCTACGKYPPEHAMRIDAAPLPEYGMEVRVDLCHDCWIAQGVLQHVRHLGWLFEVEGRGRAAIRMAWEEVKDLMSRLEWENAGITNDELAHAVDPNGYQEAHAGGSMHQNNGLTSLSFGISKRESTESMDSVSIDDSDAMEGKKKGRKGVAQSAPMPATMSPTSTSDVMYSDSLLDLVRSTKFVLYRRRSATLDSMCRVLETGGRGCASEFLENIEECASAVFSSNLYGVTEDPVDENDEDAIQQKQKIGLKKEAFKVAGDMSAALKLLYDYALPADRGNLPPKSRKSPSHLRDNADMLAAILEFFLDLCDEGQLDAVAFFWPQLCHIHMQMLPPRDTEELIRVELMEDFLLTVATRYSVHLALNLVWGLTADLEESLGSSSCGAASRRRRFAVLRFVSELESLLFDFEGGWGGGGVSLHGMLSPSQHQSVLLRDAMSLLQLHRRFGSHFLTRSVRLEKLRSEALESLGDYPSSIDEGATVRAQIAKNAAYFSSHITFARKLGDIAEKLRFTDVDKRSGTLQIDLKEVNASGKILGGDPLNRLCRNGSFCNAVRIPVNEGHVFRSKERTPVLLLVEVVKEESSELSDSSENKKVYTMNNDDENEFESPVISDSKHFVVTTRALDPPIDDELDLCTNENSSQVSASSLDGKKDMHDHDESLKSNLSCPRTPSSSNRALLDDSMESPGKLAHGVLTLTPRATEATNVTEEGKEMMADMIANLIENQQNILFPPLESENDATNHENSKGTEGIDVERATVDNNKTAGFIAKNTILPSPDPARSSSTLRRDNSKKISALGSVFPQSGQEDNTLGFEKSSGIHLTADGQFRRDVLFAIMEKGMRGNNVIARGAATAARRAIQAMDRKRAIALLNEPHSIGSKLEEDFRSEPVAESVVIPNRPSSSGVTINASIDDDEAMEALRLLIIQNRAAQGNLSPENAVNIGPSHTSSEGHDKDLPGSNEKWVDAGEVDPRLAGCGNISSSVLSALRLWKGGIVSNGELIELVQKDLQFLKHSAVFGSADENKLIEDSAFWGRFSFGERWAEKKARLAASSPHGSLPGWDLVGCIVKSNDDLRQEAFVMQLIELCAEAFQTAGLDLWVHPYDIVATGRSTGIIECVRNAMSFDSLKKRPGYGSEGLLGHFKRMTEIAADPFKALNDAKQNFVSSLAAYSLMSYLFMFKDRHNGNLLLDTAGHVIHIDFGFVFGIAPGGSFSLEQSTPFKLTDEMLEVMGGLGSPLFSEFVTLFCCGFLALQAHADTFLTVVEITCKGSNFHCFDGKDSTEIISKLRERFCPELNKAQTVAYALDLIKFATTSYGTKQYDYFQYLSQGIAT